MVNGPQSGGEMPLGKDYWKNLEEQKKQEGATPWRIVRDDSTIEEVGWLYAWNRKDKPTASPANIIHGKLKTDSEYFKRFRINGEIAVHEKVSDELASYVADDDGEMAINTLQRQKENIRARIPEEDLAEYDKDPQTYILAHPKIFGIESKKQ